VWPTTDQSRGIDALSITTHAKVVVLMVVLVAVVVVLVAVVVVMVVAVRMVRA
jgi:hypothetical protein